MRAFVTVDLGYGDSGKGTIVDALIHKFQAGCVVRYCGGHQAGHKVVTPDGRSHVFSQFGSGSFLGARTILARNMLVEPIAARNEFAALKQHIPELQWSWLQVHPYCLVTVGYHAVYNQFEERLRGILTGMPSHRSCGVGIGQTREYWLRYGFDSVFTRDLAPGPNNQANLSNKLLLIQQRYIEKLDAAWSSIEDERISSRRIEDVVALFDEIRSALRTPPRVIRQHIGEPQWSVSDAPPQTEMVVFEGAQGLMIDQSFGDPEFATWSDITPDAAYELCDDWGISDIDTIGITRCYATRHGSGYLQPLCEGHLPVPAEEEDPAHEWQGPFRLGTLVVRDLQYAKKICDDSYNRNLRKDMTLAVTCLDQIPGGQHVIVTDGFAEKKCSEAELLQELSFYVAPIGITSHSPTRDGKKFLDD